MNSDFGTFIIQIIWIFIFIMFFMIWFMVLFDLFGDHTMKGWQKAVWVVALIILPPISTLIYLIVRGKSMSERRQAAMEKAQAQQKAYIQSAAGTAASATDQIASAKALLDAGTINQSEFDALKAKALA